MRVAYRRMWLRGDESRPRWIGGSVAIAAPASLAATRQSDSSTRSTSPVGWPACDPSRWTRRSVPGAQAAALMMTASTR